MITDNSLRQQNVQHVKSRIENDAVYKQRNRTKAAESYHKKMQDVQYREQYKATKRNEMKTAYHTHRENRELKKTESRQRYRVVMRNRRHGSESCLDQQPPKKTNTQTRAAKTYWARRTRLIAVIKENHQLAMVQKKMATLSGVPLLDTKLLTKKAAQRLKRGKKMLTHLHLNLVSKATYCLEQLPADRSPTEDELTSAFGGRRMHTSTSEAYFWQQCYNVFPPSRTIPIDCAGKAHIFKPVLVQTESSSETTNTDTHTTAADNRWECDSQLCHLPAEAIQGVTVLLRNIASRRSHCQQFYKKFYQHLNDCTNPARDNRLGHSVYCREHNGCNSLLRPARTLAPHFPYLRSFVSRLYEVRRLVAAMQSVTAAMDSGYYDTLKRALRDFIDIMSKLLVVSSKSDAEQGCSDEHLVDEDTVMQQFGRALRQVTSIRDTYATSACDVCEQLRKDLAPLESYTNQKGYNSDTMRDTVDLLYRYKTTEEDFDKFLDNIHICKYCADKLRGNKEVARSFFNQLSVQPTPDCISELNLFEKALIKFLHDLHHCCPPRSNHQFMQTSE